MSNDATEMPGSEPGKATRAKNAQVQPASAAVPSEELRETVKAALPSIAIAIEEWLFNGAADDAAALTIAGFFAPILAEKEREIVEMADHVAHTDAYQAAAMGNLDRALAAEAALAAEREAMMMVVGELAKRGVDENLICEAIEAAADRSDAMVEVVRRTQARDIAAAIRAQGE